MYSQSVPALVSKNVGSALTTYKSWGFMYNVKEYGAKGDGATDDAASFQSAVNAATDAGGGIVLIPPGTYLISSTVTIDRSAKTARVNLIGAGSGSVKLKYSGSGTCISLIGNSSTTDDNYLSFQQISGFELTTTGATQGTGVSLKQMALIRLSDLRFSGFDIGLYINGVEHSKFEMLSFRWNNKGIYATCTDFVNLSCPNNLAFHSCHMGSNLVYGALFEFSTTIDFYGGSIENNGSNAGTSGGTDNWGIKFHNPGYQGGVACNLVGVYIESNSGAADVWCENTAFEAIDNASIYSIVGCTFNRGTSDHYAVNNIRCTFAIVAQAELQKLSLVNCSFKSFNSYVPDAGRKTLLFDGVPQNADNLESVGNIFEITLEAPSVHHIQHPHISAVRNATLSLTNSTWTKWTVNAELNKFDMTGALDTTNNNITLLAAGVYTISVHVVFALNTTGNRGIRIKKGTTIIGCSVQPAQEQEHSFQISYCGAAADVLTVELYQSSGGALNVLGSDSVVTSWVVTKVADMA